MYTRIATDLASIISLMSLKWFPKELSKKGIQAELNIKYSRILRMPVRFSWVVAFSLSQGENAGQESAKSLLFICCYCPNISNSLKNHGLLGQH